MNYEQDYGGSQQAKDVAPSIRKQTPAEQIRDNAERVVARLSAIHTQLESLKERLCGAGPPKAEAATRDAMTASGFIGGTGSAIERAHIEITEIDQLLAELSQVI